ncbi:MAG: TIGR03619 family F420-dependent LLM class oxidoreductase [Acidobacteria bacterium]|nr:TIGR03619 family F420-dependent LLM class oxidoreductase [Acidobacteriota bacterium]
MELGMSVPWTGPLVSPEALVRVAQEAEALGFAFLQVGDHALYPLETRSRYPYSPTGVIPTDPHGSKLDVLTLLSFLAATTTTIRLVPGVYLLSLRNPIGSARALATLDFLSGGRLTLGVGVGWMKDEFDVLGVPFHERGRITDEYLAILRHLFEGEGGFDGDYFSFPALAFAPTPVQAPLPILVGGGASGAVLRRVARFGNGWIPAGMTPEEIAAALPRLAEAMEAAGRAGEALVISGRGGKIVPDATTPAEVLGRLQVLASAGCTSALVDLGETSNTSLDAVLAAMGWFADNVMPEAVTF